MTEDATVTFEVHAAFEAFKAEMLPQLEGQTVHHIWSLCLAGAIGMIIELHLNGNLDEARAYTAVAHDVFASHNKLIGLFRKATLQ